MIKLYNTYSREKEIFKPLGKEVKIYSCGPTVYNYAHIGNLRAYIFMDVLRKVLKYNGYKLKHVMNITDVGHLVSDADTGEDKMLKSAKEKNMDPLDIAKIYTDKFFEDIEALNIEKTEIIAKATDHIKEMEKYVEKIYDNGFAYETSKGIYFDTSKDLTYGELSKVNLEDQKAGARIEVDAEKKNPLDFALWIKAPKNHLMKWDSKWGLCYPGWHIECSAMGNKYLGEVMDIHTGGIDHIPIHHENEIAQSRGYCSKNPARFWMHNEFLLIDGGKMSKSLGNVYTIKDIEDKGYSPLAYRYMCYTAHYRNKLNFTWNGLKSCNESLIKMKKMYKEHELSNNLVNKDVILEYKKRFLEAINDDLNISVAISIVWEILKSEKSKDYAKLLFEFDKILSLDIDKEIKEDLKIDIDILELLEKRKIARENKDFSLSDKIRDEILQKGYKILDTKEGQKLIKE